MRHYSLSFRIVVVIITILSNFQNVLALEVVVCDDDIRYTVFINYPGDGTWSPDSAWIGGSTMGTQGQAILSWNGHFNIPSSMTYEYQYQTDNVVGWTAAGYPIYETITEYYTVPVIGIGQKAFYRCTGLTSVTIPNTITHINYSAFEFCEDLRNVLIPNSVKFIDDRAFLGCTNLSEVMLPNSITSIHEQTFSDCISLSSINIPNSVTDIGKLAFNNCSSLTSIDIPNSVTSIGYKAFWGCTGLTEITFHESVTSIGNNAFGDCTGLETVNFNAESFIDYAEPFSTNLNISTINFGNNVQRIPSYFAYGLPKLTSITIPNSVITIGDCAFAQCDGLTSVTIPNSVTTIGDGAFCDCDELTSITIGNSVTSIGNRAFSNFHISKVICHAVVPPTINDSFYDWYYTTYNEAELQVPEESLLAYREAEGWKLFRHIVAIESEEVITGDVSGDNDVTIADVSALIDYLLTGDATGVNLAAANCDNNSEVNIADVSALIDYLLSGSWN